MRGARRLHQNRRLLERASERQHLARAGTADGDLGQEALHVQDASELLAQFRAQDGFTLEIGHGIEARFDLRAIERGRRSRWRRRRAAHAGRGLVEDADEGCAFAREHRLDQFEVTDGDGVEHHGFGAIVEGRTVEVFERGAFGVTQVVQDGAGSGDGRRLSGKAAAVEGEQAEMLAEGAFGVIE